MQSSKYVLVGSKKLHFHMMGSGPPLVMMHPSPHDSKILLPLAKALSERYTVIALDTPGYGNSDHLGFEPTSISDYTKFLKEGFEKIGLAKFSLYGSATGAQISIRYALESPNSISYVFLDNAAHFDDDLRKRILEEYFPDLTPRSDGSHLEQIWTMVSQMFQYFPWCFTTDAYALNRPQLPPAVLHTIALDFLRTGKNYGHAYKVAFEHERGEFVQQLQVPTTIFRWNGSIIAKHIDRLLSFDFPKNVSAFKIEGDAADRAKTMTQYINSKAGDFEDFRPSQHIERYRPDAPIKYSTREQQLPAIHAGGLHLNEAWAFLRIHNPKFNPEQLQSAVVDWFVNS